MKNETSVFTVRLPIPLQEQLDSIAESMDRPRSWLVTQALQNYLAHQAWYIEQIKLAIEEADRGDFATDEEMNAFWDKYNVPRS